MSLIGQLGLLGFIIFGFLFMKSLIKSDGKGIQNFIITAIFSIIFLVALVPNYIDSKGFIPNSNVYKGHGSDKIDIEKVDDGPLVLYVEGNEDSKHLSIDGYNENDKPVDDFSFSNEPYGGLLLFFDSVLLAPPETTSLKIINEGPWKVEARSLRTVETVKSPGKITGTGPDVFLVDGNVNKATIEANNNESTSRPRIQVWGYSLPTNKDRNKSFLIHSSSEKNYEGTVKVDDYVSVLAVRTEDPWTINLE